MILSVFLSSMSVDVRPVQSLLDVVCCCTVWLLVSLCIMCALV